MSGHNGLPTPAQPEAVPAPPKSLVKKTSGGGNKKGTSAERRATHNAVERARRENLNDRFLLLANKLPATYTVRRPSKSLIVNKSLDFVQQALEGETILRLKVEELYQENQGMLKELNDLRQERGLSPRSSPIDASMPLPLADNDFKKQSLNTNHALNRGSISLGGDFDDDFSGQASNSSVSSTGSPPDAFRASSALPTVSFQHSPNLSDFMDPSNQFSNQHHHQQQQHQQPSGAFSLPHSYYLHNGPAQQLQSHQDSQTNYLPPITPTTAAMFTQMMGAPAFSSEGTNDSSLTNSLSNSHPFLDDGNQSSGFAAMASNTFFDQRYSNNVSVSTPTSHSFGTTA